MVRSERRTRAAQGQARNLGARLSASAPLLCFLDADIRWPRLDTLRAVHGALRVRFRLTAAFRIIRLGARRPGASFSISELAAPLVPAGPAGCLADFLGGLLAPSAARRSCQLAGSTRLLQRPSIEDIELGWPPAGRWQPDPVGQTHSGEASQALDTDADQQDRHLRPSASHGQC